MKNLQNKVVVITGAASGIGKALAQHFAKAGSHLALNDFNEMGLLQTVKELQSIATGKIFSAPFDVSKVGNFEKFAQQVSETFGRVDIVINNAGVALGKVSVEDLSYKDLEWVMNINFYGMVYGTKSFLPFLKKQSEAALINISSVFGLAGIGHQGAYCASKFAIRGFTESLRMEALQDFPHVQIHTVHPGGIKTNIARNSRWVEENISEEKKEETTKNFERMFITTPESAAATIVKGIQKKKSKIVIGKDGRQMDWLVRLMPTGYSKIILNQLKKENLTD
ncbi:MAG: SDR family NAD(P)-dependent oxidoreductase [Saprospiraceae bacterium]